MTFGPKELCQVWVWEPATGRARRLLVNDVAVALAFSPDGKRLAAGCARGSVVVWEVNP